MYRTRDFLSAWVYKLETLRLHEIIIDNKESSVILSPFSIRDITMQEYHLGNDIKQPAHATTIKSNYDRHHKSMTSLRTTVPKTKFSNFYYWHMISSRTSTISS